MNPDATKSPDAARPLGASGDSFLVQHGNAPSPGDIKRFLEVFDALDEFSAVQMHVRGYGGLPPSEMPDPACVRVRDWLMRLTQ